MIMNEKPIDVEQPKQQDSTPGPNPDEQGGFVFSSVIKISDPNTKEILLHMRGDD
jgi:hypothetical protein